MNASVVKKIALVGHCGPDSGYLRMAVGKAGRSIQVISADDESSLQVAIEKGVDLLLMNRQLDWGFSEEMGVDLIRRIRSQHPEIKTMLVSNYPDAQAAAVAVGALPGFGKREVTSPRVQELIRDALEIAVKSA